MTRRILVSSFLIIILFTLSACSISFESSQSGNNSSNGGVYKSTDSGSSWSQITNIAAVKGKVLTFNNENVIAVAIDPEDNNAVYAGTETSGMMFSYDSGNSWNIARSLGQRKVQAIAISPMDKCIVFVSSANKILKSTDCNRNWTDIYFDNDKTVTINSLIFHPTNANIIYAGTSRGEVIASFNGGQSWTVVKRFTDARRSSDNMVMKIDINNKNPNIIWAATSGSGVYRSEDGGSNWTSFLENFMEINTKNANKINDITLSPSNSNVVIAATKVGLIRSMDNGGHWQLMDLIPPAKDATINKVAFFQNDDKKIYYITDTSFGFSEDGGDTWASKKLPTNRRGVSLLIDTKDYQTVYLGVKAVDK